MRLNHMASLKTFNQMPSLNVSLMEAVIGVNGEDDAFFPDGTSDPFI